MSFTITTPPATTPQARTLLDIFDATALRCGNRLAIDADDGSLTYDRLSDDADQLAGRLRKRGVGPGDRVGVQVASGTAELYVAILGILRSGAAYVPVDADDPPARAATIFERAGACSVVRDGLTLDEPVTPRGRPGAPGTADDAWVIFTSGSTGEPKGVAVTHRSAAAFADAEARLWSVAPDDRVLAGLSVGFDASCEEMWLAWRNGAALVPAPRSLVRAGAELGPWLAQRGVTVVSTVPTLAAMWDEGSLAGVRLLILGGEACPEPLGWRLAAGREVWNTYGPTEATVVSTAAPILPGEPVTIGAPLDGWETAVIDADGDVVEPGEPGELVIAGAGVARYLDPVLDTERFPPVPSLGWDRAYPTGDVVRETDDGLVFVGRRDHQVKIGGRRIELGEIDGQLSQLDGIRAAVTVVQESKAGNRLLVAYVVGDVEPDVVRRTLFGRLPDALVPLVVTLDELPQTASGKVDRGALPWPPPGTGLASGDELGVTAAWLAERWGDQLGPVPITPQGNFFELGGSSLAAAKLTSTLRQRFPAVAVADVYEHRTLEELAARLDRLGDAAPAERPKLAPRRRVWGALQLLSVVLIFVIEAPTWIIAVLGAGKILGVGPQVPWLWLLVGWLVFESLPARATFVVLLRRILLRGLRAGRHPRHGWLMWRLSFLKRIEGMGWLQGVAGTPWAVRYARLCGHRVGDGARLHTLPSISALVTIGDGATIEADVDLDGWWIAGNELVVGAIQIGERARVGTHSLLMPGATIGAGAEIEPGSVIDGPVAPGQRWEGSPARQVGRAGESWPDDPAPVVEVPRRWRLLYAGGLALRNALMLLAAIPPLLLSLVLGSHGASGVTGTAVHILLQAPLLAAVFVLSEIAVIALAVRLAGRLIRPGWHPDFGPTAWALWLTESLMEKSRSVLFPLYASLYTRPWLRLLGFRIGKRTEISTAVGLNRLVSFGEGSFAADLGTCASVRQRDGWLQVTAIEIGDRSFVGNGAMLKAGTRVGDDTLIGVLTTAPAASADGTSWLGAPALELPRTPVPSDPARTIAPPRRLVLARAAIELVRILLPGTFSIVLGTVVFATLEGLAIGIGMGAMAAAVMPLLMTAGAVAVLFTVGLKWLLIGRYRPGEHPLWSCFVWRDEIVNSAQEQIAGTWLMNHALGTPLISLYLRLMGARVGRDVYCEALTIVEFDAVELGDGCAVNRASVVQSHLYHDRVLRIGPARVGAGATLGPDSHILPESVVADGSTVGGRSIVMWGEQLPPCTRWHGAPVVAV